MFSFFPPIWWYEKIGEISQKKEAKSVIFWVEKQKFPEFQQNLGLKYNKTYPHKHIHQNFIMLFSIENIFSSFIC